MNFNNQQHFEKIAHKGLSLAIYLKICIAVIPKDGLAGRVPPIHLWVGVIP